MQSKIVSLEVKSTYVVSWEEGFTTVIEVLVDVFVITSSIVGGQSVVREVSHLITAIQINY
jgi:hypothetical protein